MKMKKTLPLVLLAVFLFLFSIHTLHAEIGIKGGLTFGVGFDFKLMGSMKIGIEGRYSFSLSDVHDVQPEALEDYQMKNRTFSLLLGIHL